MRCSSLHLLLITAAVTTVADCFCPQQNHTGELKFTKKLGSLDFVRRSQAIAVICCAQGYENISWYRKENNIWHRFPPPAHGDNNGPTLEEDGQLLRINYAKMTDQTSYRCDVTGKGKIIQHITKLIVIECDPLARGPIPTKPSPENQTIYEYGGNITLHCTGYFGCSDPGPIQLVLWIVNGISAEKVSPRYVVETSYKKERTVKQATLTIASVQEEDINRKFSCILATPQPDQSKTDVYIFKKDKPDVPKIPSLTIGLIIGGCVLFFITVTVVTICLRSLYGPQIRFFVSRRITALGPRYIDNEDCIYNMFIYNVEEDQTTALDIKKKLTDKHYKVYATADIEGNQRCLKTFSEKTAKSALVLFLYSEALRKDKKANLLLQSFIVERKGKDIMFLEIADYRPNEIMDWAQHVETTDKLKEINNQHEEAVNNGKENNNVDMVTETDKEIVHDLQFWKSLPRLKIPPSDSNKRKKKYFWCSLQNKIPKFADKRELPARNNHPRRQHMSDQSVLESNRDSEPLIPFTQSINANELSSNAKEEFCSDVSNEDEQKMLQASNIETVQGFGSGLRETVLEVNSNNREYDFIQSTVENEIPSKFGDEQREISQDPVVREETRLTDETADISSDPCTEQSCSYDTSILKTNSRADVTKYSVEATGIKHKADLLVRIDNEQNNQAVCIESHLSNEYSASGATNNTLLEGDQSDSNGVLSNQSSSGISENDSEVHISSQNIAGNSFENVNENKSNINLNKGKPVQTSSNGNGKLNLVIQPPPGVRNSSSSSPESGYVTSPSERSNSLGTFLPQIKEHVERGFDVLADKAINGEET